MYFLLKMGIYCSVGLPEGTLRDELTVLWDGKSPSVPGTVFPSQNGGFIKLPNG